MTAQLDPAQIADPQNQEQKKGCYFKPLDFGVICYTAKKTDTVDE